MYILGISAYFHDSAAAIIKDGKIIAALEEEKCTRIKHDSSFPTNAVKYVLEEANITIEEVSAVVFYDKPFSKFDRILETFFAIAPSGYKQFIKAIPSWIKEKLFLKKIIRDELKIFSKNIPKVYFSEHHLSHAASAFYPSEFHSANIVVIDGVGEWATLSLWLGNEEKMIPISEIKFPHSLGLLYSAFTAFLGFKVNSGEYKLMGLAPYGKPIYSQLIEDIMLEVFSDGSFKLNYEYFDFLSENRMFSDKFIELFQINPRQDHEEIKEIHQNIAASIQDVLERIVLNLVEKFNQDHPNTNLCLAGGVALNCTMNGSLKRKSSYQNIFVQPASSDAGGAIGAALAYYHLHLKQPRQIESDWQQGTYLGPKYSRPEIEKLLKKFSLPFKQYTDEELNHKIAQELNDKKIIGWFQGRAEFGPRSLGSRSIIASPKFPDMQKVLNLKIKKRESFRPFAPSVLLEDVHLEFDWPKGNRAPYMLFTTKVKTKDYPAITHVDSSARIQTVDGNYNQKYYDLLKAFKKLTGSSVLVNTSFNVRGEPIVLTPEDALHCFMTTDIDLLVLENFVLDKNAIPEILKNNSTIKWRDAYAKD